MKLYYNINNKIIALQHRLKVLYFRMRSIFCTKFALNREHNRKKRIIVSLTTYPRRFDVVHITLETIFHQTLKPDMIILYLSKEELKEDSIPKHILKLKKRGLTIEIVDGNLKSYKKLIYTLNRFPDDIIITVDDDILYPKFFLEKLYKKHIEYPREIVAYRCAIMRKKDEKTLTPYISWKAAKGIEKPSYDLFFTGVGGVLYPPNSLDKDVMEKSLFLKLAPLADDVWFKAMSLKSETKVIQVFSDFVEFPIINDKSQEDALWRTNNGLNQNDVQLKKVFDYYDLYHYIEVKETI